MRVIIACETSGEVREAFRRRGYEAYSCDILPADDNSKFHYQGDILEVIKNTGDWDLMIAHPPCTYLSVSGMHWTTRGLRDPQLTEDALSFAKILMDAPIHRICIENPVSIISTRIRKPDQIIQPWQFGHDASKKTCLWLKNLPLLKHTEYIPPRIVDGKQRWSNQTDSGQNKLPPSKDRWKIRSKTYTGIAEAMAEQWSNHNG
jgi:site-specific DNA-cytosine methylase